MTALDADVPVVSVVVVLVVSAGKPTSIDVKNRAVHVVGVRRGKVERGAGDLVGMAPIALRDAGEDRGVSVRVFAQAVREGAVARLPSGIDARPFWRIERRIRAGRQTPVAGLLSCLVEVSALPTSVLRDNGSNLRNAAARAVPVPPPARRWNSRRSPGMSDGHFLQGIELSRYFPS